VLGYVLAGDCPPSVHQVASSTDEAELVLKRRVPELVEPELEEAG
jgi:hypothetical protein